MSNSVASKLIKESRKLSNYVIGAMKRRLLQSDRPAIAEKLWTNIKVWPGKNGCWEWLGAKGGSEGTGVFTLPDGRQRLAHRVTFQLQNGLLHKQDWLKRSYNCKVECCVNPDHYKLASHFEVMLESNVHSKLSWPIVREVRRFWEAGSSLVELQELVLKRHDIDVSKPTVWAIVHRRTWKEDPKETSAAA